MERVNRTLGEHLKPVKLYYDDIKQIFEILNETGSEIKIIADEYRIDSLEEISSIEKHFFTYLNITSKDPYISVEFSPDRVWIFAYENTPLASGIFYKIKMILDSNIRKLSTLLQCSPLWGVTFGIGIVSLLFLAKTEISVNYAIIPFFIILTGFLLFYYGWKSKFKYYSIIIPKKRKESPNFWQRNKDQIILGVAIALFSSIATIVISSFFS